MEGNRQLVVRFRAICHCILQHSLCSSINLSTVNITNSATLNWRVTNDNPNNTGFSVSYRRANTNNAWIQLTNIYKQHNCYLF